MVRYSRARGCIAFTVSPGSAPCLPIPAQGTVQYPSVDVRPSLSHAVTFMATSGLPPASLRPQALWRARAHRIAYRELIARNAAALIFQTAWRGHSARAHFLRVRWAVETIQKKGYRTWKFNCWLSKCLQVRAFAAGRRALPPYWAYNCVTLCQTTCCARPLCVSVRFKLATPPTCLHFLSRNRPVLWQQ